MANRSMLAKVERAQRQRREAAAAEFSKPAYLGHTTIASANVKRQELAALIAAYTGAVTVGPRPVHQAERRKGGMVQGGSLLPAGSRSKMKACAQPTWEEYSRQAKEAVLYVRV